MKNKFGLTSRDLDDLKKSFQKFGRIKKVVIFGSRAMGNYEPYSDIDLAIVDSKATWSDKLRAHEEIEEETTIPYFIDLLDYKTIGNQNLKKHIDRYGKVIYKKK